MTADQVNEWLQASQGQVLPPQIREQLAGPVVLPSVYLRTVTASFQVGSPTPHCSAPLAVRLCSPRQHDGSMAIGRSLMREPGSG